VAERQKSWLFPDKPDLPPVWKEGEGKKVRYFLELKGNEIEFRPVEAYTLWVIRRAYTTQLPKVPIIELELEGIDAVQRTPDYYDAEFVAKSNQIYRDMDIQIIWELLKGVVVPKDEVWAAEWKELGRPLPDASTLDGLSLRRDIYLSQCGFSSADRMMLVRMIQAVSEETSEAIETAQEMFRDYLGGAEAEGPEAAERTDGDDSAGRDHDDDEGVGQDAPQVVQDPVGGSTDDGGEQPQHVNEIVRQQPAGRRTKAAKSS
jgi:hypothetical protein